MIKRIKALERASQPLEPNAEQRRAMLDSVIPYTEDFLESLPTAPTYCVTEDQGRALLDHPISENGDDLNQLLDLVRENLDKPGINPASGGHLGYIPGGGIYPSALGDYIADVTNRYSGVFFANPGAVRMENFLLRWMAELIGYPSTAAGNLTSGGSIANLTAIVTARDARRVTAAKIPRSVIYCTGQVHHSVGKAIRLAGLVECVKRDVPMDQRFRMDAAALEHQIAQDKAAGLNPFLVISSAGTTDVGAVDPLGEIGDLAAAHGLWHHVDGAYGAFFLLCDDVRQMLESICNSDSVSMDPHKGLFLPYGSGAVLVKDREALYNAHCYQANYMQDALAEQEELSPADLSLELTKHFRGLRLWLPLKLLGLKPFRAALTEKILLARYCYERLKEMDNFELGPTPDLSVVVYRYIPQDGDVNEFNKRLVRAIHADGRVFISSTQINGNIFLRLTALCFRTHLDTVDLALEILNEKARELENVG